MESESVTLAEVMEQILTFRREREWEQFHAPKNLAISLSLETAELLEHFQWCSTADSVVVAAEKREEIQDEIADIAVYLLFLCHDLGIDLPTAVQQKMVKNSAKYPVAKAKGSSKKYHELDKE